MSKSTAEAKLSPDEERVLKAIVNLNQRETKPIYSEDSIVYEGLDEFTRERGSSTVRRVLKSLASKGYLGEKENPSVIMCPRCGSAHVSSQYTCPTCRSSTVHKDQFVEHSLCGYIGGLEEFETDKGLVCRSCKTEIGSYFEAQSSTHTDQRKRLKVIGSNFVCDKCGSKFDRPVVAHVCEKCHTSFTYKEALCVAYPTYELTERVDEVIPTRIVTDTLREIRNALVGKGYSVVLQPRIPGKSGSEQYFDLEATKDDSRHVLDVSPSGDQKDLIILLGKKMDIEFNSIILLDMAGNTSLEPLGRHYGITVINGREKGYLERIAATMG